MEKRRDTLLVIFTARHYAVFAVVHSLSVTLVDFLHRAEDIVELFVFFSPPATIPTGTPSAGAQNTRGGKICDFRLKSPFILWVLYNANIYNI